MPGLVAGQRACLLYRLWCDGLSVGVGLVQIDTVPQRVGIDLAVLPVWMGMT
jgi:hypothetical protein